MKRALLALMLVGCASVHEAPVDGGPVGDVGLCLLDVPCWCVIFDSSPPYAHCHHERDACEAERAGATTPTEPCSYEGR